jgi:hypothetical protein
MRSNATTCQKTGVASQRSELRGPSLMHSPPFAELGLLL